MDEKKRQTLRYLMEIRYDYQDMRIRTGNRLSLKADGTEQKTDAIEHNISDEIDMSIIEAKTRELESILDKKIAQALKGIPVYERFLKGVKGCGPTMSCVLLAEFDIEKATTVSKMWQYAGCNPGLVPGKKKGKDGEIITTGEMVRGDKAKKGFLLPYNAKLKSRLLGVLAGCFIKSRSPYTKFYYDMKERLSQSEKPCGESKVWKNESKAHIDAAAKRYMIKMFLADLYREWRTIEGLPVRAPYQEEYLGHTHHAE